MFQCIVVYCFPISMYKCADQQQQCALWLVEVRYKHFYNFVFVTGGDYYLCTAMQGV